MMCAVFKTFVSCETHDGCTDAAGKILGKRACQDHPPARLKRRLVSQNILSKKVATGMAASMGQACRELQTQEEPAIPESSS